MYGKELNILFTSSGRRVSLLRKFRDVFELYRFKGNLFTADIKNNAPTAFLSDRHFLVPPVTEDHYLETLVSLCRRERIGLVIPLIDTELPLLAKHKRHFEEIGAKVLVSSPELVEIAGDKRKTYRFFTENGIPTPKVYNDEEIENREYRFPLLIKPLNGSASQGVTKVYSEKELAFFKEYIPNAMVQELISGQEHTIDVMTDFEGNIKTVVPRLRIETRAGEVSKGVTRKDPDLIEAAATVVQKLPGPVGCITLQCFQQSGGEIQFIEINPRFGGGIPLSIEAGANFPLWTIQMCLGTTFTEPDYNWKENVSMFRYDEAVFTEGVSYAH